MRFLILIAKYLVFLFLIFCLFILGLFFYYIHDLPRPERFLENPFIQSTKIYDRSGTLLYDIFGEEKREIVPFDKISDNLKNAVLTSEDSRFYSHIGVDPRGIARAILVNLGLRGGVGRSRSQGGSTITQQLIRSVYLTSERTLERKVKEMVLSIELERRYSKDQIFNWYLNKIPFGQNAYGIEAASRTYFNKSAIDLSLAESATLAALIPAPSFFSPYGPRKDLLLTRKDNILERMERLGFINDEELKQAKEEEINFSDDLIPIKAPHFVMHVKQYLKDKYGEDFLREKGLRVYTTLDWELQKYVEQTISEADKTNVRFDAYNTAAVVIDPKTGEILSLVGSKGYFEKSYPKGCDENRRGGCLFNPKFDAAVMGRRQPGSAFKPFVYAAAFKKGYTADTILWDVKTEFNPNCSPDGTQERDIYNLACYHPRNYDGRYRGPVSLRSSLAQSLNLPSVKLLYLTGLKDSLELVRNMGITTLNEPSRYGLSLVLGGGEVTLLEMTSAYGVFANEGLKNSPVNILRIEDSDGNIIKESSKESTRVLGVQVARMINDILSDNNARAPIFGANSVLHFDEFQVASKTGTTQYFNDAWTVGYNPSVVVGVWVGNNNNAPTNKKTGIGLAAPIWRKIMEKALASFEPTNFTKPDLVQNINPILLGQLPIGDPPHSILHYIDKNNPLESSSQNPGNDMMYFFWEYGIQNWIASQNIPQNNIY